MRTFVTGILRGYQLIVSPIIGPCCRFHPSCSEYAIEAVGAHGVCKGAALAVRRVSKCHPWHPGGVDPVPAPHPKD